MLPYDVKLQRTSTTTIAFDFVSNYPASSIMPCDVTCIYAFIIIGAVKVRQCAVCAGTDCAAQSASKASFCVREIDWSKRLLIVQFLK